MYVTMCPPASKKNSMIDLSDMITDNSILQ